MGLSVESGLSDRSARDRVADWRRAMTQLQCPDLPGGPRADVAAEDAFSARVAGRARGGVAQDRNTVSGAGRFGRCARAGRFSLPTTGQRLSGARSPAVSQPADVRGVSRDGEGFGRRGRAE